MPKGIQKNGINKGWFKKGIHPDTEFKTNHIMTAEVRKKISRSCKGLKKPWVSKRMSGENHPNWKGGVEKDRDYRIERQNKWYQLNKNSIDYKIKRNKYRNERRRKDPKFHLDTNLAVMILKALKGKKAGRRWETLVGYTLDDLMKHLENQFDDKMNWDNYGSYWTLDHIKPKSLFNYIYPEDKEFKKCWSLENLQPMEKIANIKKGNKCLKDEELTDEEHQGKYL